MGRTRPPLGAFEEDVLRAVAHLLDSAYGVTIRDAVEQARGQPVSFGATYAALHRLEGKGFVQSRLGEATPQRGGRCKRYYEILAEGRAALAGRDEARLRLSPRASTMEPAV